MMSVHRESQCGVFVGSVGDSGGVKSVDVRHFGLAIGLPLASHRRYVVSSS